MEHEMRVGGQAVIEGVMMRARRTVVAVRAPDGEIKISVLENIPLPRRTPLSRIPFLRGIVVLVDSIVIGIRALNLSANLASGEEEEFTTRDMIFSLLLAIVLAIGMFMVLPVYLTRLMAIRDTGVFAFVEGVLRAGVLVVYLMVISLFKDVKRLFQYHGAEHKSVHTYENGKPLNLTSAKDFSVLHPRCGTTFLVVVVLVSIIVFGIADTFLGRSIMDRVISRIVLVPVIAAISYEVQRIASREPRNWVSKILLAPGMLTQKITTAEPDDSQLEVALSALRAALKSPDEDQNAENRQSVGDHCDRKF